MPPCLMLMDTARLLQPQRSAKAAASHPHRGAVPGAALSHTHTRADSSRIGWSPRTDHGTTRCPLSNPFQVVQGNR